MNFRRGFIRLWIVASIIWGGGWGAATAYNLWHYWMLASAKPALRQTASVPTGKPVHMRMFEIRAPDGQRYQVEAPDMQTAEEKSAEYLASIQAKPEHGPWDDYAPAKQRPTPPPSRKTEDRVVGDETLEPNQFLIRAQQPEQKHGSWEKYTIEQLRAIALARAREREAQVEAEQRRNAGMDSALSVAQFTAAAGAIPIIVAWILLFAGFWIAAGLKSESSR